MLEDQEELQREGKMYEPEIIFESDIKKLREQMKELHFNIIKDKRCLRQVIEAYDFTDMSPELVYLTSLLHYGQL